MNGPTLAEREKALFEDLDMLAQALDPDNCERLAECLRRARHDDMGNVIRRWREAQGLTTQRRSMKPGPYCNRHCRCFVPGGRAAHLVVIDIDGIADRAALCGARAQLGRVTEAERRFVATLPICQECEHRHWMVHRDGVQSARPRGAEECGHHGRRYTHGGRVAHLLDVHSYTFSATALCGQDTGMLSISGWLGTGSQREYERAEALPLCRACERRHVREHPLPEMAG